MKKIVLAGGTGFLGQLLLKSFTKDVAQDQKPKYDLVVLGRASRAGSSYRFQPWDARTLSEWAREVEGAFAVINLTGQNVKCLYTEKNLKMLKDSRVLSTQVIGQAIKQAKNPPKIWVQMSSASIYAHSLDEANDEEFGQIGEPRNMPLTWKKISMLVQDWEHACDSSHTEHTRKILIRCGVVMGLKKGGAFDIFYKLCRWGLGGNIAGGRQMVSWIHEDDFVQAIQFLLQTEGIAGPVNVCAPNPISQSELMRVLRQNVGAKFGLPAPRWLVWLSSYIMGIDSELSLKSRYVIPKVLQDHKFRFQYPYWRDAVKHLCELKNKQQSKV